MDIEKIAERAALEMVQNGIIGHASHVMAATRAVLAIALRAAAEEARTRTGAFANRDALFDRGACTALTDYSDSLCSIAAQLGGDNA